MDASQTPEAFETIVIERLRMFMEEQREKINGCAIDVRRSCIGVVFGQRDAHFDAELQDAISENESILADANWVNVHSASLPNNPNEEQLADFARFHIAHLLSDD